MGEFGMRVEENINYGERTKGSQEYLSPRRKPGSSSLKLLDSGVRRNDVAVVIVTAVEKKEFQG